MAGSNISVASPVQENALEEVASGPALAKRTGKPTSESPQVHRAVAVCPLTPSESMGVKQAGTLGTRASLWTPSMKVRFFLALDGTPAFSEPSPDSLRRRHHLAEVGRFEVSSHPTLVYKGWMTKAVQFLTSTTSSICKLTYPGAWT